MKKRIDKKTDRNRKIERFLSETQPETPCLVVALDVVAEAYQALRTYLPLAKVFYAVKANPAGEIVDLLRGLGSSFDVASRGEVELCLGRGVTPECLSFGNTIKKERDIAYAYERGVRLFAFDSAAELEKLARSAPGARVFCRILVEGAGAEWPLSRKFGCAPEMAVELLRAARQHGLDPYGVSFHVGSQQTNLDQWDSAVGRPARMFSLLAEADGTLRMVNIGGRSPPRLRRGEPRVPGFSAAVIGRGRPPFRHDPPPVILQPRRPPGGGARRHPNRGGLR